MKPPVKTRVSRDAIERDLLRSRQSASRESAEPPQLTSSQPPWRYVDGKMAAELIQAITQRDSAMTEALTKDWDRTRFPDAAAKLEPVFDLRPKDQMLFAWKQAANYSASLAGNPDRFYQILQSAKAGRS